MFQLRTENSQNVEKCKDMMEDIKKAKADFKKELQDEIKQVHDAVVLTLDAMRGNTREQIRADVENGLNIIRNEFRDYVRGR